MYTFEDRKSLFSLSWSTIKRVTRYAVQFSFVMHSASSQRTLKTAECHKADVQLHLFKKAPLILLWPQGKDSLVYLRTCNEFEGNVSALGSSEMWFWILSVVIVYFRIRLLQYVRVKKLATTQIQVTKLPTVGIHVLVFC